MGAQPKILDNPVRARRWHIDTSVEVSHFVVMGKAKQQVIPTKQQRVRLSIDVPREVRRRIHIAAANRDQSIRDYVCEAVEVRLQQDGVDQSATGDLAALNERDDPILANLWKNPKDAAFDRL
jgi:hypothetical protein